MGQTEQKVIDLDVNICDNQEFVMFFRGTVEKSVGEFRKRWLDAFIAFYGQDVLMIDILNGMCWILLCRGMMFWILSSILRSKMNLQKRKKLMMMRRMM